MVFRLEERDMMEEGGVHCTEASTAAASHPFQSQRTQIFPLFQRLPPHILPINSFCVEPRISKAHNTELWQNLAQYAIFKKEKNTQQKL